MQHWLCKFLFEFLFRFWGQNVISSGLKANETLRKCGFIADYRFCRHRVLEPPTYRDNISLFVAGDRVEKAKRSLR